LAERAERDTEQQIKRERERIGVGEKWFERGLKLSVGRT
jgi:hypothetical protein